MTDIVERLRSWVYAVHSVPVSDLLDEAAAEIERMRNGAPGRCETVPLTDAEREAIEGMAAYFDTRGNITLQAWGSLLRVLLMRWK